MKLREKESTSIVNTFGKKDEPPLFIQTADRILTDTSLTMRYSFSRIIYLATAITQFTRVIPISVTLEVYFTRELHRKVSYLQGRLTNPEYNFISIQLFWKTDWKQICSETFFQQH